MVTSVQISADLWTAGAAGGAAAPGCGGAQPTSPPAPDRSRHALAGPRRRSDRARPPPSRRRAALPGHLPPASAPRGLPRPSRRGSPQCAAGCGDQPPDGRVPVGTGRPPAAGRRAGAPHRADRRRGPEPRRPLFPPHPVGPRGDDPGRGGAGDDAGTDLARPRRRPGPTGSARGDRPAPAGAEQPPLQEQGRSSREELTAQLARRPGGRGRPGRGRCSPSRIPWPAPRWSRCCGG
jgi:hypothetical protein